MATTARTARLDMRVDTDTKQLAERASAAAGYSSLTDFVTHLIRENAPEILKQQTNIELSNQHFDQFMAACMDDNVTPSPRILEAAKRLDQEGF
ncbi:MAG: DUF1778 domain-containing protein [Halieaceae bacterium]|jgi:uncharacterized protein (DUF1778 family)|nr:DUF1778 domain-containing protein [Halieaceae bacterium]